MKFMSKSQNFRTRSEGFSLVEVILAIGVFALTIVAVIGLLGPIAQQVRDLQDTKVANSLPAPIREELNRLGFTYFVNDTFDDTRRLPAFLVGTEDGSRVVAIAGDFETPGSPIAVEGSAPPAIDPDDQYFAIQVFEPEAGSNLSYNDGDAHVAFRVEISWPNRLPGGAFVQPEDRRTFEYHTAIVVGEPF